MAGHESHVDYWLLPSSTLIPVAVMSAARDLNSWWFYLYWGTIVPSVFLVKAGLPYDQLSAVISK